MNSESAKSRLPLWVGPALFLLTTGVVVLLGLLAFSITERRWETQRPAIAIQPIAEWEPDNAAWGANYPREYERYLLTRDDTTRTMFGGSFPRDYLEDDPRQVLLFAGYPFSKEYRQARGHYHSVTDVTQTKRISAKNMSSCWTCKSTDVPKRMAEMGVAEFYATPFSEFVGKITHPIGCQDCHDPKTMNLRITRPALREAFAAMGKDIDQATHQEMRSLVCAQCHVEYYFKDGSYVTLPWAGGLGVEQIIAYYDALSFTDWTHAISKTSIIKSQHPDYELYSAGIHAYGGVACADCHMPYRTEGGVKFTDHHVQSPLLNIANSCAVCHRWGEEEIRSRVEAIQTKVANAKLAAEDVLVRAHFDIAAAMQAGATDEELAAARKLVRHAQYRWDFVSSHNGVGFHAPQECTRILGDSAREAQEARLLVARLLAAKGISAEPKYPDLSTRDRAVEVKNAFESGQPTNLL
ncbi:MAG TPA: ammonia-forming cytochrome c nitrite reductase subunit c552 [Kiritimatiellia bacterium]|nr:ammonia-forming cytochrome c nitrite reductase subunit c552 [Kiritimatiellia bacterium]HRZ11172.1 ammonia-forming cytochrome c nitrite reductase subunit c552 [Kiritimatiellia bacterium]HSA19023.1 ammonia-forming cytochrome c nitrite reductase subunit c552 [Kiritimatiellia bacterium]